MELAGEEWVITTARNDLDVVRDAIDSAGTTVREAALAYIPNNPKVVEGKDAEKLVQLYEALEDNDDVQDVFANFDISDEVMEALSQDDGE